MAIYLSNLTGSTQETQLSDNFIVWTSTEAAEASTNVGYFVDTSSAPKTINLPATPQDGDTIAFIDLKESFDTNNLTIGRNGKKIMGLEEDMTVSNKKASFKMVYSGVDGDWRISYVISE